MAFPTNWQRRQKITLSHTPAKTMGHFPVLVNEGHLASEVFTLAQASGGDLRFTMDAAGTIPCPHEIEAFGASKTRIHVRVPIIGGTDATPPPWWWVIGYPTKPQLINTSGNAFVTESYICDGTNKVTDRIGYSSGVSGDFEFQFDVDFTGGGVSSTGSGSYMDVFLRGLENSNVFKARCQYRRATTGICFATLEQGGSWVFIDSAMAVSTAKFKLSRVSGIIKLYYWKNSQWEWNGSTAGYMVTSSLPATMTPDWQFIQHLNHVNRASLIFSHNGTVVPAALPKPDANLPNEIYCWYGNSDTTTAYYPFKNLNPALGTFSSATMASKCTASGNDVTIYDADAGAVTLDSFDGTGMQLTGDFDIVINFDYTGADTPSSDVLCGLKLYNGATLIDIATRLSSVSYTFCKFIGSSSTSEQGDTTRVFPAIRLTRVSGVFTGYRWESGAWKWGGNAAGVTISTTLTTEVLTLKLYYSKVAGKIFKCKISGLRHDGAVVPWVTTSPWDDNFAAVYHLNETGSGTAGEFKDATKNELHAAGGTSPQSTPDRIASNFVYGQQFTAASSDNIKSPESTLFCPRYQFTIEAVTRFLSNVNFNPLGGANWSGSLNGPQAFMDQSGNMVLRGADASSAYNGKNTVASADMVSAGYSTSATNHVCVIWDLQQSTATEKARFYYRGAKTAVTNYNAWPSQFHDGVTLPTNKAFYLGSNPIQSTFSDITCDEVRVSTIARPDEWVLATYKTLQDSANFAAAGAIAAYSYTLTGVDVASGSNEARFPLDTTIGVIATVALDKAIGNPTQQNTLYTGASHACVYSDGTNIRTVSTRLWEHSTDVGPFWVNNSLTTPLNYQAGTQTPTLTIASVPGADFDLAYCDLSPRYGRNDQLLVGKGNKCLAYFERDSQYDWHPTSATMADPPSDMARSSVAGQWLTPIMAYVTTGAELKVAFSSALAGEMFTYSWNFDQRFTLKTGLPNSGDSTPQSVRTTGGNAVVWTEYVSAGKYKLLAKMLVSPGSSISNWASADKWSSEIVLLDGVNEWVKSNNDFRVIASDDNWLQTVLWREGNTLKYKLYYWGFANLFAGTVTLTSSLPGTNHGFTGGSSSTWPHRNDTHVYYLKDKGDGTSDLCEYVIRYDITAQAGTHDFWYLGQTGTRNDVTETVIAPALSLRTTRISTGFHGLFTLGVLYHDSANRLCMVKRPFHPYHQAYLSGGSNAVPITVGYPWGMADGAPKIYGNSIIGCGSFAGSVYMNIYNLDTQTLRWPYPQRLTGKICDPHHATFSTVDSKGYLWILGRGRSGEPEDAPLYCMRSKVPINDSAFSRDLLTGWDDISPGVASGRGYKHLIDDQWGNMYLFWQASSQLWFKVFSYTHSAWSAAFLLGEWNNSGTAKIVPDDFRWRSRKAVKDANGAIHLFIGARPTDSGKEASSSGLYYWKLEPISIEGLSVSQFQALSKPEQIVTAKSASGDKVWLPTPLYNPMHYRECLVKSGSENFFLDSSHDNMKTWAANTSFRTGTNLYDLTNRKWFTMVDCVSHTETAIDTFANLNAWTTPTGSSYVTAASNKYRFTGTSLDANSVSRSFLTANLPTTDFDIVFDVDVSFVQHATLQETFTFTVNYGASEVGVRLVVNPATNFAALQAIGLNGLWLSSSLTLASGSTVKLRLTRFGNCLAWFYWNATLSRWEWDGNVDGANQINSTAVGSSINFYVTSGGNSNFVAQFYNFNSRNCSGTTGSSAPAGFSTSKRHELVTDNQITWKNNGHFFDGFVRSYDWCGDILSSGTPIAGFALRKTDRYYPGEIPTGYTGFPWLTWNATTYVWDVNNEDTIEYCPASGMTNNGFGDVFISTIKTENNSAGHAVTYATAYSTRDGATWKQVTQPSLIDSIDSATGCSPWVGIGDPSGNAAVMTFTDAAARVAYFQLLTVFEGGQHNSMFRGQFGGYFGGNL